MRSRPSAMHGVCGGGEGVCLPTGSHSKLLHSLLFHNFFSTAGFRSQYRVFYSALRRYYITEFREGL